MAALFVALVASCGARVPRLPRSPLAHVVASALLALAACGDNLTDPADAGTGADAATCPVPEVTRDRDVACKLSCRDSAPQRCPGPESEFLACYAECVAGVAAGSWCVR